MALVIFRKQIEERQNANPTTHSTRHVNPTRQKETPRNRDEDPLLSGYEDLLGYVESDFCECDYNESSNTRDCDSYEDNLLSIVRMYQCDKKTFERKLKEAEVENAKLQKQIKQLHAQSGRYKQRLEISQKEVDALKGQLESLEIRSEKGTKLEPKNKSQTLNDAKEKLRRMSGISTRSRGSSVKILDTRAGTTTGAKQTGRRIRRHHRGRDPVLTLVSETSRKGAARSSSLKSKEKTIDQSVSSPSLHTRAGGRSKSKKSERRQRYNGRTN